MSGRARGDGHGRQGTGIGSGDAHRLAVRAEPVDPAIDRFGVPFLSSVCACCHVFPQGTDRQRCCQRGPRGPARPVRRFRRGITFVRCVPCAPRLNFRLTTSIGRCNFVTSASPRGTNDENRTDCAGWRRVLHGADSPRRPGRRTGDGSGSQAHFGARGVRVAVPGAERHHQTILWQLPQR